MASGFCCSRIRIYQHSLPTFVVRSSRNLAVFSFPQPKFFHSTSPIRRDSECLYDQYNHGRNWGFVIYRTIYTTESDVLWPRVMEKLEAYIHRSGAPGGDPERSRQGCALLKNVVMSDKDQFDGATIPDLQKHFAKFTGLEDQVRLWKKDDERNKADVERKFDWDVWDDEEPRCKILEPGDILLVHETVSLLVDQEVLEAIRDAPDPDPKRPLDEPRLYVKAVDGCYYRPYDPQLDETHPRYTGWAFVNADALWFLYEFAEGEWDLGGLVSGQTPSPSDDAKVFFWDG